MGPLSDSAIVPPQRDGHRQRVPAPTAYSRATPAVRTNRPQGWHPPSAGTAPPAHGHACCRCQRRFATRPGDANSCLHRAGRIVTVSTFVDRRVLNLSVRGARPCCGSARSRSFRSCSGRRRCPPSPGGHYRRMGCGGASDTPVPVDGQMRRLADRFENRIPVRCQKPGTMGRRPCPAPRSRSCDSAPPGAAHTKQR